MKRKNGRKPENSRGRQRGQRSYKMDDRGHSFEKDSQSDKSNDISWWNHNPELTKSAGNYSFNNPLGQPIAFQNSQWTVPGIAVLNFSPTIGIGQSLSDPVNVAAGNIYTWVRHMNSGSKNYEAPDYMMYLLAMDSLYMYHAWMCRLYGLANTYSITNRYVPRALINSIFGISDVDPSKDGYAAISGVMADLLYYINNFAVKVGSFAVPDSFDYYKRHRFLVSHVFADAGNDKAQLYVYNPGNYFMYSPATSSKGTELLATRPNVQYTSSSSFIESVKAFGESLLAAVFNDEDFGVMSGDTLKAFGKDNLIALPILESDYAVLPEYNVEVLGQIHNSTIIGNFTGDNTYKISQNNGVITFRPTVANTFDYPYIILNSYDDEPSAEQVMLFTRNLSIKKHAASGTNVYLESCGTEVINTITIYTLNGNGAAKLSSTISTNLLADYAGDGIGPSGFEQSGFGALRAKDVIDASQFDWFPLLYVIDTGSTAVSDPGKVQKAVTGIVGDLRNYTVIKLDGLQKLHETALLSAFSVEQVGRVVK